MLNYKLEEFKLVNGFTETIKTIKEFTSKKSEIDQNEEVLIEEFNQILKNLEIANETDDYPFVVDLDEIEAIITYLSLISSPFRTGI